MAPNKSLLPPAGPPGCLNKFNPNLASSKYFCLENSSSATPSSFVNKGNKSSYTVFKSVLVGCSKEDVKFFCSDTVDSSFLILGVSSFVIP